MKLPYWITYWPIKFAKPRKASDAIKLLRRCHIDAKGSNWFWIFQDASWVMVPRSQAVRAETTLARYGFKILGRRLA